MSKYIRKMLATAAAVCVLLVVPCGCGEDNASGGDTTVSTSQVVDTVSGADVISGDGWYEALSDEERQAADVVLRSVEAMNARDIEGYMATVDPQSKVYDITREDAEWVFSRYRLAVTVDQLEVESMSEDTALITVTQTTLPLTLEDVLVAVPVSGSDAISGSDVNYVDPNPLTGTDQTHLFAPCVTVLEHNMSKRDGVWYVTSTVIESYREISTQWDILTAASSAETGTFALSGDGVQAVSGADAAQNVSDADAGSAGE